MINIIHFLQFNKKDMHVQFDILWPFLSESVILFLPLFISFLPRSKQWMCPDKSWTIFESSFGEIYNQVCMELESTNFKLERYCE